MEKEGKIEKKAEIMFEVSWEVCNKVGGIFTVVKSKASYMVDYYKDDYFLIGPYFPQQVASQFTEEVPKEYCKKAFEELKKEGIICHSGKWLTEGNPNVILVDFEGFKKKTNEIKKEFWEKYRVDSIRGAYDYDEPLAWAYAVGKVIEQISNSIGNKKIVGQFHEWLSAPALLYLNLKKPEIGTVFTTHATTIGRTLAGSNVNIYDNLKKIDVNKEIYEKNIEAKHHLEQQGAIKADVFTTVSGITGIEAEYFLGRKPEILLLNGLDIDKFPTIEEISIKHRIEREKIREFLEYYFFPYYNFDIEKTLLYFLAGRYEYHTKGIDVFIRALGKLNEKMKKDGFRKTIIVFIWVPANIRNIKPDLLENKTNYLDIKDTMNEVMDDTKNRIMSSVLSNSKISKNTLFDKQLLLEIKGKVNRFKKKGVPPLCTHDLYGEDDIILSNCQNVGLNNAKDNPVKVIFYPIYLSGADGLLNTNYYESMLGSHLGIFPSYYEPWGYTPAESGALGVPSITTDLSGFGMYLKKEIDEKSDYPGIYVIDRYGKSDHDTVNNLAKIMFDYSNLPRPDRIANKLQARKIASKADWKIFIINYILAHNKALEKK